ncbi:MAG TPA: hypothetical protein VFS09_00255 [Candidatus Eisenbacteria bacterium]|nr:hypothetical protein [Candidatus Eisenbacteria bacterium]
MSACYFCGGALDAGMRIVRDSECPSCRRDLHACVQCRHYDPHAHNKCREPQAEWVTDRERRNFCDYFKLDPAGRPGATKGRADSARQKLNDLFKTKEPDSE